MIQRKVMSRYGITVEEAKERVVLRARCGVTTAQALHNIGRMRAVMRREVEELRAFYLRGETGSAD